MAEITLNTEQFKIDDEGNLIIHAKDATELLNFVQQVQKGGPPKKAEEPHFLVKVGI